MSVYSRFLCLLLVGIAGLGWHGRAMAGCCLDSSRTFTDYSGTIIFDTGPSQCAWHFSHCDITQYGYVPCEEGPSVVVSFRVHPGAECEFYSMFCLTTNNCGYVMTSQGLAFECTTTCE
jgi:hypothetical protein